MLERVFIAKPGCMEIPGIYQYPDSAASKSGPAVLMIHGFMAYKEGDGFLLTKIAQTLAGCGVASLRIDCTSMGENRNDRASYDMNYLLADVTTAYQAMAANPRIDSRCIGLLGHSLGGRLVTLAAAELNPAFVITLNGALFNSNVTIHSQDFADGCAYAVIATSDGRHELLYRCFAESQKDYDVYQSVRAYAGPFCVCYGTADPTVKPQTSIDFYDRLANREKEIIAIEDANHTFNAKTNDYTKVYEAAGRLAEWLKKIKIAV